MSQPNDAAAEAQVAPSVHVWMTVDDAAQTLGTSSALLSCQIELGELESRLNDAGAAEVLIALPPRNDGAPAAERVGVSIVAEATQQPESSSDSIPAIAGALVPMLQSMREAQRQELRGARRSARLAWAVAAVLLMGGTVGATLGVRATALSRQRVTDLNEKVQQTGAEMNELASERDALRTRLGEAQQAAARFEGEVAVERHVEDTLLKAALSNHASQTVQPNAPAFANGAE